MKRFIYIFIALVTLAGCKFGFEVENDADPGVYLSCIASPDSISYYLRYASPLGVNADDIPEVKFDPEELAKIPVGSDKATYLKENSTVPGVKRWGSLALGFKMDPSAGDEKPEVDVVANGGANKIALFDNFKVDGAVFKVDGNEKKAIDLDFTAGNVVTHTVTVEVGGKVAMTTQIGANKVAEKTGRTLVTVPWAESNASEVQTVATLFNTASLSENDKVEVYDPATDVYKTFKWNGTEWSGINEIDGQPVNISAGETELQLGQAVWFTGSAGAVQAGTVAASVTPQVAAGKWGLVANPVSAEAAKSLNAIVAEPIVGDIAQVMDSETGKSTIYSYKKDKGWGYDGFVNGRPQFVESVPDIDPGQALWFSNSDTNPENKRTLNFSDVAK